MGIDLVSKLPSSLRRQADPTATHRRSFAAVAITVGHRNESGTPINRSKFYVMNFTPTLDHGRKGRGREFAPDFQAWNRSGRAQFHAMIVHSKFSDAADQTFRCQLPGSIRFSADNPQPAGQRPWCSSSGGVTAVRWDSRQRVFSQIPCLSEACPHYLARPAECKLTSSMTFALTEPGFPQVQAYWTTGSIINARTLTEWYQSIEMRWQQLLAQLGLAPEPLDWMGFPVLFSLAEVKRDGKQYPVVQLVEAESLPAILQRLMATRATLKRQIHLISGPSPAPAGLLAEAYPDADANSLEGPSALLAESGPAGMTVSDRPRVLDVEPMPAPDAPPQAHDAAPVPPPLALLPDVPTSPQGWPLCPRCQLEMQRSFKRSAGVFRWVCRPCVQTRAWDGSLEGGAA